MPEEQLSAAEKLFGADPKPDAQEEPSKSIGKPKDQAEVMFGSDPEAKDETSREDTEAKPEAKPDDKETKDKETKDKETKDKETKDKEAKDKGDPLEGVEGVDPNDPYASTFREVVTDLGLDPEGTQKLVDMSADHAAQAWNKISDDWVSEAKASPSFETDIVGAKAVLAKYGDPALLDDLARFRFGNHPALIKFLGKISKDTTGSK